jgi:hypothetical protein
MLTPTRESLGKALKRKTIFSVANFGIGYSGMKDSVEICAIAAVHIEIHDSPTCVKASLKWVQFCIYWKSIRASGDTSDDARNEMPELCGHIFAPMKAAQESRIRDERAVDNSRFACETAKIA